MCTSRDIRASDITNQTSNEQATQNKTKRDNNLTRKTPIKIYNYTTPQIKNLKPISTKKKKRKHSLPNLTSQITKTKTVLLQIHSFSHLQKTRVLSRPLVPIAKCAAHTPQRHNRHPMLRSALASPFIH